MAEPDSVDSEPSLSLQLFLQSLKEGDATVVDSLISEEALSNVQAMLNSLKQMADADPEGVSARLASAGYGATADDVDDWDAREYLGRTVSLPAMIARYMPYDMTLGEPSYDGDRVTIPVTFMTQSGFVLESEAVLDREDEVWKISVFLGLNSFP